MKDSQTDHLTADEIERLATETTAEEPHTSAKHLRTCGACRREVDFLRALDRRLVALPHAAPSAGFEGAVMARVRMPVPWRKRAVEALRPRWAGLAAATASVALAVGAMSYWLFGVQQLTPSGLAAFVLDSARVLALRGLIAAGQLSYSLGLTQLAESVVAAGWAPALAALAALGTAGFVSMMIMWRLMQVRISRPRVARR
jgi:hypothetical protein